MVLKLLHLYKIYKEQYFEFYYRSFAKYELLKMLSVN